MARQLQPSAICCIICMLSSFMSAEQPRRVFPGEHWEHKSPAEVGLAADKLQEFARYIGAGADVSKKMGPSRGCVVKDGYMVYTWGEQGERLAWYSASKPVLSTLLFFAIHDGKLKSVDDRVADWGWSLVEKDRTMTFRHLADMTSGYACDEPPGQAWAYNDFAILLYAMTLERVLGSSIRDAARWYFAPLQLEDGDLIGNHLKGRGVSTTPRDFARIGWFWLNRGNWAGQQLLPQAYFDTYMRPDVPGDLPRTLTAEPDDYLGIGSYGAGHDQTRVGPGLYGFNWWFNAPVGKDGALDMPDAPADLVMAKGYGGNVMMILPSQRIVVAARAKWGKENTAIRMLLDSIVAPVAPSRNKEADAEMLLDLGNNVTMRLVWVPAGAFTMGSSADEAGHEENEGPQHEVTISRPFLIGACEVTQEQYEAVMGSNPSKYPGHGMPVENVSWDDAMEFCARVSRKTGRRVTLPTEAQWEYACRAGTRTRYSFGDDQDQIKRYARQGEAQEAGPAPVGSHEPNPWGLYDMYGNVWEWCADWYAPYNAGAVTDPAGPASGQGRVVRGGRWHGKAADCRSAKRSWHASDYPRGIVGFRVVLATDEAEGESSTRSSVTSPGEARVSDDP